MTDQNLITAFRALSNDVISALRKPPVAATILPELLPTPFLYSYGTAVTTVYGEHGWLVAGTVNKSGRVGYSMLKAYIMADGTWVNTCERVWTWQSEISEVC